MDNPNEVTNEEVRFRKVFEEGPLAMALIGLDHRFIQINAQLATMLGYSRDELMAITFHEFTHPEDLSGDLDMVEKLVKGEVPHYTLEKRYIRKDGVIIWGKLTASLIRDENDAPQYFLGMVEDITARRQAEEALWQSESRFRSFMDNSPALAFIRDEEGRYIYVNRKFEEVHKISFRELAGKKSLDFVSAEIASVIDANDRAVLSAQNPLQFEEAVDMGNGRIMTWLTSKFPMKDYEGNSYVAGVAIDVTRRKRIEEELRERDQRMQTLMHTAHEGVWLLDAKQKIQYVNPRMTEMTGYVKEEFLGRPVTDFVVEDEQTKMAAPPEETDYDFKPQRDFCLRCKNGSLCWVQLSGSLILDSEGKPAGSIGMLTDVTERRSAEAAQRRYTRRLQTLRQIDQAILAAQSARTVAEAVMQRIPQLLPCQRATISLFDLELQKILILANYTDDPNQNEGTEQSLEYALHMLHLDPRSHSEVICEYVDLWAFSWLPPWIMKLRDEGIRSGFVVPLIIQGELIGNLKIWSRELNAFSTEHRDIVLEVADSLAVAIAQANLHQRVLESQQSLQAMSRRLVEVQEVERRSLARELHDQIGQDLTALKIALEMGARGNSEPGATWVSAQQLVNDLTARVRQLSFDLRPSMLDDLGLIPALVWQFERYMTQTGIEVVFKHTGVDRRFETELETATYRIVQEALTNVARHSGAREVAVRLWADGERVGVQVEDKGCGFAAQTQVSSGSSLGITAMRERALLLQGHLNIESNVGEGTCITAEIPIRHSEVTNPLPW